ncbi:MAG: LptE family protein [Verrucomicrobia bacterium]|nr:LptE family protein [Verrucomicrobiota bacterium]
MSSLFLGSFVALGLTGCAGYKLGPSNGLAPGAKSVQINPFANQTLEPRLSEAVTYAMRKNLQQDGTFRLDTHGDGDIIVTGVITHYARSPLSFQPTDIVTVRDYRLHMTVQISARERSSGKVILDRAVSGFTTLRVGNDLTSEERQAIPLLADNLAKNATSLLADGSW